MKDLRRKKGAIPIVGGKIAIREIRIQGDSVLEKKCKEVKEVTPRIRELIDDMLETMS